MAEYTEQEVAEFRGSLLTRLKEEFRKSNSDKIVQYLDVSCAFPNGPHERSFEIRAIDQDALNEWCSENGFKASFLTEKEDPENFKRGLPPVRFWRTGNQ